MDDRYPRLNLSSKIEKRALRSNRDSWMIPGGGKNPRNYRQQPGVGKNTIYSVIFWCSRNDIG